MTKPLPSTDTKPWYRQLWPWFLISLPASVVVAGLTTAYIANKHADDLVADEYYKDGLAINRQLEKKQRALDQGISAQLYFNGDTITVKTTEGVQEPTLRLLMSHPLEADRDFTVILAKVKPGLYRGIHEDEVAPRWHWILEAPQPNGWRLDGAVLATDFGNVSNN
jgi:hypothetical protein